MVVVVVKKRENNFVWKNSMQESVGIIGVLSAQRLWGRPPQPTCGKEVMGWPAALPIFWIAPISTRLSNASKNVHTIKGCLEDEPAVTSREEAALMVVAVVVVVVLLLLVAVGGGAKGGERDVIRGPPDVASWRPKRAPRDPITKEGRWASGWWRWPLH